MKTSNMTKTNPMQSIPRERIELFLAQALSELTNSTAQVAIRALDFSGADSGSLTIQVLFVPSNPEEGETEH